MVFRATELAAGEGWSVQDCVCGAGPDDRPFEQRHQNVCIAAVMEGTFQYRCDVGARTTLVPGALLLGHHGRCFECDHEHGVGDRCLAFHYEPGFFETILRDVPGARRLDFAVPGLPPADGSLALIAAAQRDRDEPERLQELALALAACAAATTAGLPARAATIRARDRDRVTAIVRQIEERPSDDHSLGRLARGAGMSRYHFLRTFRAVTGTTPHQFVLNLRLRAASALLAATTSPVTTIAFDAGFSDLSAFNNRFRRVFGVSPRAYRSQRQ